MKQIDLREGARRQHRAVALFAVIQCWLRGLDGLAFQRRDLQRLLGLTRFKGTRVEWLQQDFRELFPHQQVYWLAGKQNSLHSVVIARQPVDEFLPSGSMSTATRLSRMKEGGPRLGLFQLWAEPSRKLTEGFEGLIPFFAERVNFDERFLSSYLALLVQGQISPKKLPPLQET